MQIISGFGIVLGNAFILKLLFEVREVLSRVKKRESASNVEVKARLSTGALSKMASVDVVTLGTISVTSVIAAVILAVILYIGFKSKNEKEKRSDTAKSKLEEKPVGNEEKRDKAKQTKGKRGTAPVKNHHRQFAILKGHTGYLSDLEFSLNGKYLASTSQGYF